MLVMNISVKKHYPRKGTETSYDYRYVVVPVSDVKKHYPRKGTETGSLNLPALLAELKNTIPVRGLRGRATMKS